MAFKHFFVNTRTVHDVEEKFGCKMIGTNGPAPGKNFPWALCCPICERRNLAKEFIFRDQGRRMFRQCNNCGSEFGVTG